MKTSPTVDGSRAAASSTDAIRASTNGAVAGVRPKIAASSSTSARHLVGMAQREIDRHLAALASADHQRGRRVERVEQGGSVVGVL